MEHTVVAGRLCVQMDGKSTPTCCDSPETKLAFRPGQIFSQVHYNTERDNDAQPSRPDFSMR